MSDLISRQAAIEALESYYGGESMEAFNNAIMVAVGELKSLPSVGRPTGKWTKHPVSQMWICNDSNRTTEDFCPNCGADMRGEENE